MAARIRTTREIHRRDNIDFLANLAPKSIDLIYIDPPFNSGRAYEAVLATKRLDSRKIGEQAFNDSWLTDVAGSSASRAAVADLPRALKDLIRSIGEISGRPSTAAYVGMMAPRLFHACRALRQTGSLYLHCDPAASHYLKLVLDALLGSDNFRNEIIWKRTHAHSSSRRYGPIHDVILFYSASAGYTWHTAHTAYRAEYLEKHFRHEDDQGQFQLITCTAPGDRAGTRAHYEWRGQWPPPGRHWAWRKEQMEEFDKQGRLVHSSTGVPRLKRYVSDGLGVPLQDIWLDIPRLDAHSEERIGFETQKPLTLLERIISASSSPGDTVLDPFCGSGTTLVMAERLQRSWVGVDESILACSLALGRVRQEAGVSAIDLQGFPGSTEEANRLRRVEPTTFGVWATGMLATTPCRADYSESLLTGIGRVKGKSGSYQIQSWIPLRSTFVPTAQRLRRDSSRKLGYILDTTAKSAGLEEWIRARLQFDEIRRIDVNQLVALDARRAGLASQVTSDLEHSR